MLLALQASTTSSKRNGQDMSINLVTIEGPEYGRWKGHLLQQDQNQEGQHSLKLKGLPQQAVLHRAQHQLVPCMQQSLQPASWLTG